MKKIEQKVSYVAYSSEKELEVSDQKLLQQAHVALESAYAPYSTFRVGAAVLLANGEIVTGNNQENVAYPNGICAERVALFYANARYPDVPVKTIAIAAKAKTFELEGPTTPCGACRQVIAETENRFKNKIRLILQGSQGEVLVIDGINNLLPLMFRAENLKK